jgi:hypothetical protein
MVSKYMKPDADPVLVVSPVLYERLNLKDEQADYDFPVVVDGLNHQQSSVPHDFDPDPEAA